MPDTIASLSKRGADALRLSQELKEPKAVQALSGTVADLHAEADKLEAAEDASRPIFFVKDGA